MIYRTGPRRPVSPMLGREITVHVCKACGDQYATYGEKPRRWKSASWCGCRAGQTAKRSVQ